MEIFYGGLQVFMEVMSFSPRPILRWFRTTQNSSFVEAEGTPYSEDISGVERK